MTISDLTPVQFYSLMIMANVITVVAIFGLRELMSDKLLKRQKAIICVALAGGVAAPCYLAIMALRG